MASVGTINSFSGEYAFLSNFYKEPVEWEGITYPTVEHAFQAAKNFDRKYREQVRDAKTPGDAKKLGRATTLRPDWEAIKLDVMTILVTRKFTSNAKLAMRLVKTSGHELVEGNDWGDTVWGVVNGEGTNLLGKILMTVRDELIKFEPMGGDE